MRDFYVRRRAVCLARGRKERRLLRFNRCSPLTFRSPMFFSSLCLFSVSLFSSLCRPSLMLFSLYLSFSFRSTLCSSSSVSALFTLFTPATLSALFFLFFRFLSFSLTLYIYLFPLFDFLRRLYSHLHSVHAARPFSCGGRRNPGKRSATRSLASLTAAVGRNFHRGETSVFREHPFRPEDTRRCEKGFQKYVKSLPLGNSENARTCGGRRNYA